MCRWLKNPLGRGSLSVLAVFFFLSGCATTGYQPKQSGLIKTVSKGYKRDGELYKRGLFNRGLVKATQGNEEAHRLAKKGNKNAKWSFALTGFGLATYIPSILLLNNNQPETSTRNAVGFSLLSAGLVSSIVSIFTAAKSQSQALDAINIYNDDALIQQAPKIFRKR